MSTPNVFWFIPTHGDSRYLGTSKGARPVDADYTRQIAVAADTLGYDGVLLPTGRSCEDAWVVASSLIHATRKLKFLVAIRPGLSTPGLTVRMASTFDRLSNGRLLINVVTGGDQAELEADGVFADHGTRYEISDEFIRIWRAALAGEGGDEGFHFSGKHLAVKGARKLYPPVQKPYPPLYLGGGPAGFKRIARLNAGWLSMTGSAEDLSPQLEQLRDVAGRDVPVIHFHGGEPTATKLEAYRALGVEHLLVDLPTEPRDETLHSLDELQAELAKLA